MDFHIDYQSAVEHEFQARLRRIITLRAMSHAGMSQSDIARRLGVSQPAVSQQLKAAPKFKDLTSGQLVQAVGPILKRIATEQGFSRLGVFGSVARATSQADSDIDFIAQPPKSATLSTLEGLRHTFSELLEREVDLITYAGIKPALREHIKKTMVLL